MKKSRYSDEQIVRILREADKDPVPEVAKRHGVSEQSIHGWRKRFSGMAADDVKELKNLTQEKARLKKLLAERDLEIEVMKEINAKKVVSAPARRIAAFYAIERGVSQRRACALMGVSRSNLNHVPSLPIKNALVVQAMMRLSAQYPRYGSRRIRIFLGREGIKIGKERCGRLWAEHALQVPRKRSRKRIATGRPRPLAPLMANSVGSYDFVFDACANGQQLKCLTVVDEFTRESLAIDVAGSIRSARVIDVLAKLISVGGAPRYLRSDNGPEFVSTALLQWVTDQKIESALIDPGKPWQNGTTESFNGKFRDECLAMEWSGNRLEAKVVIEVWRQHYNTVRPHSSLNYETPEAFGRKKSKALLSGATPN